MASAVRTAAATLEHCMAGEDALFHQSVKVGYLQGAIQQAISELERGFSGFALETLRNANERMGQ